MNFNSLNFAWFLPLVFVIYWLVLGRTRRGQNVWILAMSYLFYGWWDWRFCFLLAGTTLVTYLCALPNTHRKAWTAVAIVSNLSVLVLFKYFNFFSKGLQHIFSFFGWGLDWFTIDVLLPVGISFYTFQAISYSVDVYRGDISPTRNFIAFAGFLSFFPQLVAGPIERASQLLPQFLNPRKWDYANAVMGLRLILWGLFKKCAVADALACLVDPLWNEWSWTLDVSSQSAFTAAISFAIQLYADFSGYCDIARGTALLLGFNLMVNFRYPYFSRNVLEFWHRWHISLMQWFTRYVYIPLGGSRKGNSYINIMVVFLLSGLWHGADLTFLIWGAMCGLFYIVAIAAGARRFRPGESEPATRRNTFAMAVTFFLYALPCLFFRAPDLSYAIHSFELLGWQSFVFCLICLAAAWITGRWPWHINFKLVFVCVLGLAAAAVYFSSSELIHSIFVRQGLFTALLMFMVEWRGRRNSFALQVMSKSRVLRFTVYIALYILIIMGVTDSDEPFLYFQF